MTKNKTRDGIKLKNVARALMGITGVSIRTGTKHPLIAFAEGYPRPCPLAPSTDARRMVVPWIREVTQFTDTNQIYSSLRNGSWDYV